MTLEGRLAKRLREWQNDARVLQNVLAEMRPGDEASPLIEKELTRLRRCIDELAADLMARNGKT